MIKSPVGNSAEIVTTRVPFLDCSIGDQHYHLFEVIPGVPIGQAIEQAICLLYSAHKTNAVLLENQTFEVYAKWAVCFQVEMARALAESVFKAVND